MNEIKPKEENKTRKFKDDLEYLVHSLTFIQQAHDQSVEQLRAMKEEQNLLQGDMNVIHSARLQQACGQIFNGLTMQQKEVRMRIKESLVDLNHVRSIYKKVKMVTRK